MKYLQPKTITMLALLRHLRPKRPLTNIEAERIAELQANRLREVLGISQARLPEEAISELPRIYVRRDPDLPTSGHSCWDNGRWVISLNALEPIGRQRFSLAHEFFHIVSHNSVRAAGEDDDFTTRVRAEWLADYFAGCLLMPKRHVKRLFGQRRSLSAMADTFGVTPRAMHVRMSQLGLIERLPRCDRPVVRRRTPGYYRTSLREGVAA